MNPAFKNSKTIFILVLFLTVIYSVSFSQDKVATAAAPFLGINIGGSASALGGAYVSMARDASSIYWNPGAMSRIGRSELSFASTSWFLDTKYNWGAVIVNLDGNNAFGVNMAILDYGEENVTTVL